MNSLKIILNLYYPPVDQLKRLIENNDIYIPINGGSSLKNDEWCKSHLIFDDTGDNISSKNKLLNEMTSIYWIWKHYDEIGNPDYIGFNHYRRLFNVEDCLDCDKYDAIVSKPVWSKTTFSLAKQYKIYHVISDLQVCVDILRKHNKDFAEKFKDHLNHTSTNYAPCNMFVLSKEKFFEWCEFIFPVLEDLEHSIDLNGRDNYQRRALCFLTERIFGFWCKCLNNVKEVDIIEHLDWKDNNLDARNTYDTQKVDVFIPCVYKDANKLNFVIPSLIKYCKEVNDIHISMPDKMNLKDFVLDGHNIYFHNDMDVLPVKNLNECQFRPNWIYQQLLKLFQKVTKTRYTFIFDADCILTNKFELFDGNKFRVFKQRNDKDESAFMRFINKLSHGDLAEFETGAYAETRFIADMQVFDRNIIDEMVHRYFGSEKDFIDFTIHNTFWYRNRYTSMFISEYELYALYIEKFHSDVVTFTDISKRKVIKNQMSQKEQLYTEDELKKLIDETHNSGYQILWAQSACGNVDVQYKV